MSNVKDGATGTVLTAPSPADSGTSLVLQAGEGAFFPTVPFYVVAHPVGELPLVSNSEKLLVTEVSSDTFTITRAQGIYSAKSIATGWRVTNAIFMDDLNNASIIENEVPGGAINGSNYSYTLASVYQTGSLKVYKNGVRMKGSGNDFTEVSGGFTMTTAPAAGTVLLCDYCVVGSLENVGTNSYLSDETPTGLVNSANTTYYTGRPYIASSLEVYINGLRQKRNTDFTENAPSEGRFGMTVAPTTGDTVFVNYQFNLNPSSNADTVDGVHADTIAPVGCVMDFAGATAPTGWLMCYGQSVLRASYPLLFAVIGTLYGSVDGTTFTLPDVRGRVIAGQDDMGGTSANRLTNPSGSTINGIDGDVMGGTGGSETHTITTAQMPSHTHEDNTYSKSGNNGAQPEGSDGGLYGGHSTGSAGSDTPHNNVQPTIIMNKIIRAA